MNVDVSIATVEVTTNDVPAVLAETVSTPTLTTLVEVSWRNIRLLAVTAVVEIVAVPPTKVPVPAEALEPVVMLILLPAVPRVRLPLTVFSPPPLKNRLVPSKYISPLFGEVGAVPEGMLRLDAAVVAAFKITFSAAVIALCPMVSMVVEVLSEVLPALLP